MTWLAKTWRNLRRDRVKEACEQLCEADRRLRRARARLYIRARNISLSLPAEDYPEPEGPKVPPAVHLRPVKGNGGP